MAVTEEEDGAEQLEDAVAAASGIPRQDHQHSFGVSPFCVIDRMESILHSEKSRFEQSETQISSDCCE